MTRTNAVVLLVLLVIYGGLLLAGIRPAGP